MMKTEEIVLIGKALSDKNRVEIIKLLSEDELCACHLLEHFDIKQPTLSHHMKILKESGLINVTKKSTWSYYSINKDKIDQYTKFLKGTYKNKSEKYCDCESSNRQ